MDLEQLAFSLNQFKDNKLLWLDFNDKEIILSNRDLIFKFQIEDSYLKSFIHLIFNYDKILLAYDIKNLLTRITFCDFNAKMFDLKVIELFLGIHAGKPENYSDAIQRFKLISEQQSWKITYKNVHYPLITRTIPKIERNKIIVGGEIKHAFYEIEGQSQGRLSCQIVNEGFINPHSMDLEFKKLIKPNGINTEIISFDYNHMEVSVLQWLTKDELLLMLMEGDFYENLYKFIFGKSCKDSGRKIIKQIFLPMIYGAGDTTLSASTGLGIDQTSKITNFIYSKFSNVFDWLDKQEIAVDYFGRKRIVEHKYQIRNFVVHTTAAMICQHKLIQLSKNYNVLFFIHDEYVLLLDKKQDYKNIIEILEKNEDLYHGLKLKTSYSRFN